MKEFYSFNRRYCARNESCGTRSKGFERSMDVKMNCELYIQNNGLVYEPVTKEGIEWSTERKGSPGKLTFKLFQDARLNIQEGNAVQFKVDGQNVFYGYIFKKTFDKEGIVSITCYDQLRYFKNKDNYVYKHLTAGQLLQKICDDFLLHTGVIEDTEYVIEKKSQLDKTLFDIVQSALDDTLMNIRKLFVLYDDFGRISLQNIGSMKLPILIDEETGQNFDYTSSIDAQTYNQIKLTYENKDTGKRDVYMVKDSEHINEWGILQYHESLQDGGGGVSKAEALLQLYNRKTRNLAIKDALGDVRVRAGTSPVIQLKLGDVVLNNFMVCDRVTHVFKNKEHTMDLNLLGGDFIA